MENTPLGLVSVIVPFFNDSEWLLEALESVVCQTYTNWEAIVIDDGSKFEHSAVALKFSLQHPGKIKYIEHEGHVNKGVTISRNTAIAVSSGSYIALLDADDKWLPCKLQHQVDLFMQYPAAQMVAEASRFWYSWNNDAAEDIVIQIGVTPDRLYPPRSLTKKLYPLGEGTVPCPSGIIIRKAAFERSGGFEPAFSGIYQLYEDQGFLAKIYLHEAVYISGTPNNLYRKRANSMSSGVNDKAYYEKVRRFFLAWLQSYLIGQNITDPEITTLINDAYKDMNETSPV